MRFTRSYGTTIDNDLDCPSKACIYCGRYYRPKGIANHQRKCYLNPNNEEIVRQNVNQPQRFLDWLFTVSPTNVISFFILLWILTHLQLSFFEEFLAPTIGKIFDFEGTIVKISKNWHKGKAEEGKERNKRDNKGK